MSHPARQPTVEAPPTPPLGEPARPQAWTPPPAYRADARPARREHAERPALYYGCAAVATLCAAGWIAAGIVDGAAAHFVLAAVWLATMPFFVRAARRAEGDRR